MTELLDSTALKPQDTATQATPPIQVPAQAITAMCKQPMTILARGITSLLAHLNYEGVIVCFAEACGELCAEACWCNDVLHTISLRKKMQQAFEKGMKHVPSMQPQRPMPSATKHNGKEIHS